MGSALPVLSGREVVRIFESFGWQQVRQTGSHIILVKDGESEHFQSPIIEKLQRERYEA